MKLFRKYLERKRQERADQDYIDDYLDVQRERQRAKKKRTRSTKMVTIGMIVGVMIALSSCNIYVTGRFADGTPSSYVKHEVTTTTDPTNALDKVCILTNGACPFWESPKIRYWEQFCAFAFEGYTWILEPVLKVGGEWRLKSCSPWHNFLTCEKELPNTDDRCKHVAIAGTRG